MEALRAELEGWTAGTGAAGVPVPAGAALTPAEVLVLTLATVLFVVVLVERTRGTLTPRLGMVLMALAMLALCAVLLHVAAP